MKCDCSAARVAVAKELTRIWVGTLSTRRDIGWCCLSQSFPLGFHKSGEIGIKFPDLPSQVTHPEELPQLIAFSVIAILPIKMHETSRRNIKAACGEDMVLDRKIVQVVGLDFIRRLHLYQSPAVVGTALENVDAHEQVRVLKRCLEYRRNGCVVDSAAVFASASSIPFSKAIGTPPENLRCASNPTSCPCSMRSCCPWSTSSASSGA